MADRGEDVVGPTAHNRRVVACVVAATIIVAGAGLGAGAALARVPGTGTLELCKSAANGMAGAAFEFSVNGGAPITVAGGTCTGPMTVASGPNTIVESPTDGLVVGGIKANRLLGKDLANGSVSVRVKRGTTPATETLVTYVNKHATDHGSLVVCKRADPLSPSLIGNLFSFSENGAPAFSIAAGTVAQPVCSAAKHYPLGTNVTVAELPTSITHVSAISVSDGRGSNSDLGAGTVIATVGTGVTVVTYTNAVNALPQWGYLSVCVHPNDEFVTGSFDFQITAPAFATTRSVTTGQCTAAIQVPAGAVDVVEAARFPYAVRKVEVRPAGRLVTSNPINRTATVTVPVGDPSTQTQVTFKNTTLTGRFKVCKTLTPNSTALAGSSFDFTVADATGTSRTDTVIAAAAGSTACMLDTVPLPLDSDVTITEQPRANVGTVGVAVSPEGRDEGSSGSVAKLKIGSGFTTATFTNMAFGTLEICKDAVDSSTAAQTFSFSVNGQAPIALPAGQCTPTISVPAGSATVQELGSTNFHLVGVAANDARLTSAPIDNPATVLVPFGGVANETTVTFTNAVDTGQLEICKASAEPSLQSSAFDFAYSYTVDGVLTTGSAALEPGQCSGLSGAIPVVDPGGDPIPVSISETPTPTVVVTGITAANGTVSTADPGAGTAEVFVARGVTQVTYTNALAPPVGLRRTLR